MVKHYIEHSQTYSHAKVCVVCGKLAYTECKLCKVFLHLPFLKVDAIGHGANCFIDWHSDPFFGLAKEDYKHHKNLLRKDWKPATRQEKRENAKWIEDIKTNKHD